MCGFLCNFASNKNGMVSKKVKRNISATLACVGVLCILARAWYVIMEPESCRRWLELCGMLLLTYLCFDNYRIYRRQADEPDKIVISDGEE